jgi:hypothetical protein
MSKVVIDEERNPNTEGEGRTGNNGGTTERWFESKGYAYDELFDPQWRQECKKDFQAHHAEARRPHGKQVINHRRSQEWKGSQDECCPKDLQRQKGTSARAHCAGVYEVTGEASRLGTGILGPSQLANDDGQPTAIGRRGPR